MYVSVCFDFDLLNFCNSYFFQYEHIHYFDRFTTWIDSDFVRFSRNIPRFNIHGHNGPQNQPSLHDFLMGTIPLCLGLTLSEFRIFGPHIGQITTRHRTGH